MTDLYVTNGGPEIANSDYRAVLTTNICPSTIISIVPRSLVCKIVARASAASKSEESLSRAVCPPNRMANCGLTASTKSFVILRGAIKTILVRSSPDLSNVVYSSTLALSANKNATLPARNRAVADAVSSRADTISNSTVWSSATYSPVCASALGTRRLAISSRHLE